MRLKVNDTDISLLPGEKIELTRSNAQVARLGDRSGSFTNDFQVKMDAKNKAALGYTSELSADNTINPETRYSSTLTQDAGGEISRGFVQIVSADHVGKTFTLTFFTDNTSWIDLLRGKSIRDIFLSDFTHIWSEANIVSSWTNTDGYIYPLVDYGRLTFQFSLQTFIDDWYPAVFQSTLIRRMFEDIGWVVEGSFIESWVHKHTVIAFTNDKFLEANADELEARAEYLTLKNYRFTEVVATGTTGTKTETIDINTIITDNIGAFNLSTDRYTADRTLNNAVFVMLFSATTAEVSLGNATNTTGTITIQIEKNGSVVEAIELVTITGSGTVNSAVSGDFIISTTQNLVVNDYITASALFEYSGAVVSTTNIDLTLDVGSFAFALQSVDSELLPGGNVTLANNLPDIDQADYVKDIIIRHGLLAIPDQYSHTVKFEPLSKVVDNSNLSQDLSEYVNILTTSSINFNTITRDYAKKSQFFYANPNTDDQELAEYNNLEAIDFGGGELEVEGDFLQSIKEIYRSVFEATVQIKSIDTVVDYAYLPYIPRISYDGSDTLRTGARLLLVVQNTDVNAFTDVAGTVRLDGTTYTETAFAYFNKPLLNSSLDSISESLAFDIPNIPSKMGEGLLDRWYPNWLDILNKPRYVRLGVRLFPHKFEDLDLSLPVYIDGQYISGYFLIDQVIYRDGNDELLLIQLQ